MVALAFEERWLERKERKTKWLLPQHSCMQICSRACCLLAVHTHFPTEKFLVET